MTYDSTFEFTWFPVINDYLSKMAENNNHGRKHSLWMGVGEKVISFVVGVIIASFFLGGARAKIQTLGKEMEDWKSEWKAEHKHITQMDLEGSVATKNFVAQYEKEQAKQYDRLKHLEDQVGHLPTIELRVDRLERETKNHNNNHP